MTFCLCFAMGTVSRDFNWFMSFTPFHIVPQCSTYSLAPFHIVVHIVHIVSQLPGIFSRFRRSRSQPGGQFLCVAVAYQKLKPAILMYKPELAGFSRCETMGPCSIPNSKPKSINGFSCVARSILYHFKLKILKRRVADRHISISAEFFVKKPWQLRGGRWPESRLYQDWIHQRWLHSFNLLIETFCAKMHMNAYDAYVYKVNTHRHTAAQSLVARRNSEENAKRMGSRKKVVQLLRAFYHEIRCVAPAWMWTMERSVWLPQATAGYNSFPPAQLSTTI